MGTWNETNGLRSFGVKPLCQEVLKIELVTNYNKISVPKKKNKRGGQCQICCQDIYFSKMGNHLTKMKHKMTTDINRSFTKLKPSQEFYICWNNSANPRDKKTRVTKILHFWKHLDEFKRQIGQKMVRKAVINDPMVEVSFNDQRDSRKPVQPAQLSISRKNDITGSGFYILLPSIDPLWL